MLLRARRSVYAPNLLFPPLGRAGERYNAPNTFPVLYCAGSQMTAMLEVEALFTTADGQLRGVARDPDLVLSLRCVSLPVS